MKKIIKMIREEKLKANQILEKWNKADEIKMPAQKKEKKPFDWSKYPSKQIAPRPPIIKKTVEQKMDNLKLTSKTPVPSRTPVPAKSPAPPKSPLPAKSPVPPVPVKIISTGETKEMNAPKLVVTEPDPAPRVPTPVKIQTKQEPAPKIEEIKPEPTPVEVTRPISAIRPTSSNRKIFMPNKTNRVYSPLNAEFPEINNPKSEETNQMDLSDVKRPPSSTSKNASPDADYIKNDTYPEIKGELDAENAENISMESGSVSIKPSLSPESNDIPDQMNEQTSEV